MAKAQSLPEKEGFLLVLFRYGDPTSPTQVRYTDLDQSFSGYAATPSMEVELPENTGHFDEKEVRIVLPLDTFTDRISSGVPHSPTFVRIEEVTQGLNPGDQNSQRTVFNGRIMRARRNYQGRSGSVGLFALSIKSRMDIPLGLPCNHHCAWNLFSLGCGLAKSSFITSGVITDIDGQVVTTAATQVVNKTGTYWRRGYIEKNGLRIMIRDWSDSDPTKLYLSRRAPDEWLGDTLTFVPGCDKTIEVCRARWNNEQRFMGIGYAIPPYNPIFESPS